MYDVLCYGAICADHRIYLPRFPRPGEGMRIRGEAWTAGGNALIEARALAAAGRRVALMGDPLGEDEGGAVVWAALAASGVEGGLLRRGPAFTTVVCRILLPPDGERTILALRGPDAPLALPGPELLAGCRVVSLTRYGPGVAEVGRLARAAGRPLIVGDALEPDEELAALAGVIVTSAALLGPRLAPGESMEARMAALHRAAGAAVLVTDGPRPARALWAEGGELRAAAATPPAITVRDPVGAGDTFRAAVVGGILDGRPWPAILEAAVAAASAMCARGAPLP